MSYEHGEHVPGKGWYDASLKAFVNSPGKVTPVLPDRTRRGPFEGVKFRDGVRRSEELVAEGRAANWQPNPEMETLRRFRNSDRQEERDVYRRSSGTRKMQLGNYEAGLAAYLNAGNDLPDGVAEPKGS